MAHRTDESDTEAMKIPKLNSEWWWRVICTLLLLLNLWAKVNYVSASKYQKDQELMAATQAGTTKAIGDINNVLTKMQEENKVNDRQEEVLKDHEARLRALERRPVIISPSTNP